MAPVAAPQVCIIDSGVAGGHPDLAGNVGRGWNLVPANDSLGAGSVNASSPEFSAFGDTEGHGTHLAGEEPGGRGGGRA